MVHAKEIAPRRKMFKERINFLLCVNGDGSDKLRMMIIGKSTNPKVFKNCAILLEHYATKNAWMTLALSKTIRLTKICLC